MDRKKIFLPEQCTPESFAESLSLIPHSIYMSDEFSIFLNDALNKKYGSGIIEMITKLYDSPEDYTLSRRENPIFIDNPFLNFMVFIQPNGYSKYFLTEQSIGLGFPQRFEVLYISEHENKPRKEFNIKDLELENALINTLRTIDDMFGKIDVEAKFSKEQHELIFHEIEEYHNSKWKDSDILTNFPSRLADQVYKNSVLIEVANTYFSKLDKSHISHMKSEKFGFILIRF